MRIEGTCNFCGVFGDWEAGLFDTQMKMKHRPEKWSGLFPWNKKTLPKGVNFSPESLRKADITTRLACPNCYR